MKPLSPVVNDWRRDRVLRLRLDPYDSDKCARIVRNAATLMEWEWVEDLTAPNCVSWLQQLARDGLSRGTMRNRMGAIRGLGSYLVQVGEWVTNPLADVKTPKVRAATRGPGARAFTPKEVRSLIEAASVLERTHANARKFGPLRSTLYRVLFETGLRYGEAMALEVRDIDFDRLWISVRQDKSRRGEGVPIGEGTAVCLRRYIDAVGLSGSDRVFRAVSHRTLTRDMERAGVPRRVDGQGGQWHCFRKGIVTHHLKNGVDLKAVQKLARHASAQTTLNFYYQLKDSEARRAVDGGVL